VTLEQSNEQRNLGPALARTRRPVLRARHMPGTVYNSADILAREKQRIFMTDWLCVGRIEEIENPGDYLTLDVLDEPLIVARDSEGAIAAFANVCRHRGVAVAQGRGNTASFRCPYHGWTYDLAGRLTGAPLMTGAEGFDPTRCSLARVQSDTWAGWIYVTFNDRASPLAAFLADYAAAFDYLRQEDCRLAYTIDIELDCNWKLAVENLLDIYHGASLHSDTLGAYSAADRHNFELSANGGYSMVYEGAPMSPDGRSPLGQMPWMKDKPESFITTGHLAPNLHMFGYSDTVQVIIVWPLSLTRSRLITYALFPAAFFARPDFADKAQIYRDYLTEVLEEDRSLVISLQGAMASHRFRPGPMARMEGCVHNAINHYLDRMFPTS
jgi:phenylpropionate dioxygenase-like ring-hydroxylating dioxygenase large terminal subunit